MPDKVQNGHTPDMVFVAIGYGIQCAIKINEQALYSWRPFAHVLPLIHQEYWSSTSAF